MHKTGFKMLAVAVVMVAGSTGQAGAKSLEQLFSAEGKVFQRSFSVDEVKSDEQQQVESIRFEQLPKLADKTQKKDDVPTMEFEITVKFRHNDKPGQAAGVCFASEEQMDCRIDCDGSGFYLKADDGAQSNAIILINSEGFQLNGCNEDSAKIQTLKPDLENNTYRLDAE